MKLVDLLKVLKSNQTVWIIGNDCGELTEQVYRVQWHHKELLNREVKSIRTENDTILICLVSDEE